MRMIPPAFALAAILSIPAAAQDDGPPKGTLPPAPVSTMVAATQNSFKLLDQAIKEMSGSVQHFQECLDSLVYLRRDLAETESRLKGRNGGKIPSDQLGLLDIKRKRVDHQHKFCLAMTKDMTGHFDVLIRSLSTIEPRNSPGIPARRARIVALREKFTASVKKFGMKTGAEPAPEKDAGDGDDGSGQ